MRFRIRTAATVASMLGLLSAQQNDPSSKYFAFRAVNGGKDIVSPQRIASALHARAFQDDVAKRYRIVVVERPDAVLPDTFQARIKDFENRHRAMKRVEVYDSGKGLSVPTGQIIVVFKDGTSSIEARDVLARANVKIVGEPTKLLPQQFVVEAPNDVDSSAVAKLLALDARVSFTEPDLLQISIPSK